MTDTTLSGDTTSGDTTQPEPVPRRGRLLTIGALVIAIGVLLLGGFGLSFQPKLSSVQKNDNTSFLPASAESTKAGDEATRFLRIQSIPGFLVFYRDTGLTVPDRQRIAKAQAMVATVPGIDKSSLFPAQFSGDGTAAAVYAPLTFQEGDKPKTGDDLSAAEQEVVDRAEAIAGDDLAVYPAGVAGIFGALLTIFNGLDSTLLYATLAVVIVILLVVYRSPMLWIFPLFSALFALGMAVLIVYLLAEADLITLTGSSQGILFVLVMGAGTDYALLLISRYREELHRYENRFDAMFVAWKESAAAIVASAVTVIIGVMCLSFSELNSNKGLGPVAAIGVGSTVLVMMTFLPVALAAAGRWVFWPRRPNYDRTVDPAEIHGIWGRIAEVLGRRRRAAWIGATALLLLGILGVPALNTSGLSIENGFTDKPAAAVGQDIYNAKFPKGTGSPAIIVADAAVADRVMATAAKVAGISSEPGGVCLQVDIDKARTRLGELLGADGCPPADLAVSPIGGRTIINATLVDSYDSPEALATVERLRNELHAVPGADVLVGGSTAATYDAHVAAVRDNKVIIPIVLAVIFLVLVLLLRALVAPILLIASVVLSFAATLGVCGLMFTHVFHFAGTDQSFPLFAFVFLVALGIDYNIFLMTRVREETLRVGTRPGILRGLAVTGGVITSAGVVLAATFGVLGVVTLVFLVEVGFAVAFGVLLDTIIVRSILVPALSYDIGKKIWWPSKLARRDR